MERSALRGEHEPPTPRDVVLRRPTVRDGAAVWALVRASGRLDANSSYAYLLVCTHFADTCVIAERDGRVVGFVTAYRPPSRPEVIFVWQIAVAVAARGQGLATSLLRALLDRPACVDARFLEATVAPSNQPSKALFHAFARRLGVPCNEEPGFGENLFPSRTHELELLMRIGPLDGLGSLSKEG